MDRIADRQLSLRMSHSEINVTVKIGRPVLAAAAGQGWAPR